MPRFVSSLICLFLYYSTLLLSDCLERDEENVCVKKRLVKVLDVYSSDSMSNWDCEQYYQKITCERIRSGDVDIESVYFVNETLTCCPGWNQNGEDSSDDEDEDDSCNSPCEEGYFGENCQFECRCINGEPSCNPNDGSCDCLDGWTGRQCDQRCPPGFYGPNCTTRTPFICDNNGTNHPATGECLCPSKYEGLACEVECPTGTECGGIHCEQCSSHSLTGCDLVFGACFCRLGWGGRYCTDLCPAGFGEDFCKEECCSQRGRCFDDPTSSDSVKCLCDDGYFGLNCELECPDGFFGRDCKQECACPKCDSVTGRCEICPSGYKGPSCLERCSASEWGPSCASSCSCSSSCDVFSGRCSDSNVTWLLVVLLIFVVIALTFVGFIFYRHRKQKAGGESRSDELPARVPTESDPERYSEAGSTQQYTGVYSDGSMAAQIGPNHHVEHNGSTAKHQGKPLSRANAHNPLYGIEDVKSSSYDTGKPTNFEPHFYEVPRGKPQQPNIEGVHEYDYLSQGLSKMDEFNEVGPVYHAAYQ